MVMFCICKHVYYILRSIGFLRHYLGMEDVIGGAAMSKKIPCKPNAGVTTWRVQVAK